VDCQNPTISSFDCYRNLGRVNQARTALQFDYLPEECFERVVGETNETRERLTMGESEKL
jgi:hypothetical protein